MADALMAKTAGARGAVEAGRRVVKDYNCQGCHILEDKGGHIREAMTTNRIDLALAPPVIRGEGAKVQSDWLFSFLNAPRTGQIRPWLKVHMPTFGFSPDQINVLTSYFASLDKARYPFEERIVALDPRSLAAGSKTFEALKCAQCHPTSEDAFQLALRSGKTPADLAPILAAAHDRLRYEWIAEWIKRPEEWMPGTRMPTNFPKMDDGPDRPGKRISPLAAALDTPAFAGFKRDLVAIWGSEEEAKAYIGDPDRVTKALRDHVWSLGNDFLTTSQRPKAPKKAKKPAVVAAN
jgi:cytochrome c2